MQNGVSIATKNGDTKLNTSPCGTPKAISLYGGHFQRSSICKDGKEYKTVLEEDNTSLPSQRLKWVTK